MLVFLKVSTFGDTVSDPIQLVAVPAGTISPSSLTKSELRTGKMVDVHNGATTINLVTAAPCSETIPVAINTNTIYSKCHTVPLSWSSASNNLIGYLTVGNLIGTGVTIGSYYIEWHKNDVNGTLVLISGTTGVPGINQLHPMENVPIISGNLYAVIKWVYIDGVKYSSTNNGDGLYSPDLATCMGYITVDGADCSNGNQAAQYPHYWSYTNNVQLPTLASRSIDFYLNPDGTSNTVAFWFVGSTIADRIRVYYVSQGVETLLQDWVVGSDAGTLNYNSTPKIYPFNALQYLLPINTAIYVSGDYLRFQINPAYNAPLNTNTNWSLQLKCFTTVTPFNCIFLDNETNTIDAANISVIWDQPSCNYYWIVPFTTGYTTAQVQTTDIWKYLLQANQNTLQYESPHWFAFARTIRAIGYAMAMTGSFTDGQQTYTITKTGDTVVFQFQNNTDYQVYKTNYDAILVHAHWVDYSTDETNILHYKGFNSTLWIALNYGDSYSLISFSAWKESVFTFNDQTYTMTIVLADQVIAYTPGTCDTRYSDLNGFNQTCMNFKNLADFVATTKVLRTNPLQSVYYAEQIQNTVDNMFQASQYIQSGRVSSVCTLNPDWWFDSVTNQWYFYKYHIRITITNNADPINNYQVFSRLNADGSVAATWTLVKQVP